MLGISRTKPELELAAHGKHPAFDDYFNLNMDFPLANALSVWVENGVKRISSNRDQNQVRSYRFWVRGIKKHELILGIVRDSSDRMGRPYPLLILCNGQVKEWENSWHRIFFVFEPVFRAFEELTASRYDNFKEFETRLTRIRYPENVLARKPDSEQAMKLAECMKVWFRQNKTQEALCLPIANLLPRFSAPAGDQQESKPRFFKKKAESPGAVFQGGLMENPMLTMFTRPLRQGDFVDLFGQS